MLSILSLIFIILMIMAIVLNVFSLPGNWVMLILLIVWSLIETSGQISKGFVFFMGAIIFFAEMLEFVLQIYGVKKFGGTREGNWGGMIGALIGAVLGAPFLFGLGAIAGALTGAYVGCFLFERFIKSRDAHEAVKAAWGAFWGKFLGLSLKMALGVLVLVLSFPRIWPF